MSVGEVDVKQSKDGLQFTLRWWQLTLIIMSLGGGVLALRDSNNSLGNKIESLDGKLGNLGVAITELKGQIRESDAEHGNIELRLSKLEGLTSRGVPPDWMMDRVDLLEQRLEKLETRK